MNRYRVKLARSITMITVVVLTLLAGSLAQSAPLPGGTLDPTTIPKYVTPLVIPPVMPKSVTSLAPAADYDIAVRQFKQQILPGGIWGSSFPNPAGGPAMGPLPATTVWSYGRAADSLPNSSAIGGAVGVAPAQNSTFNYPAFTVETTSALATKVRWINDLKDPVSGNFLPHLFNVDQTLHWANPPAANCVMMPENRTDCETAVAAPYTGPVPFVTHVHGAHVQPHSDGYPEAWWLPAANNIPAGYSLRGSHFGQGNTANTVPGSAFFSYENSQPATTLWYHDHALGMTRLNVYAGPAGFWLIRGGVHGDSFVDNAATGALFDGKLPGPAPTTGGGDPNFDATARNTIREIPIAIQDRSFNSDGSLFYPADRTFFDGFTGPFIGNPDFLGAFNPGPPPTGPSDMPGIWNPEAFFNTMVVNGTTWPKFEVANALYRLRLLDGCNSRTLNLSLFVVTSLGADGIPGTADDVFGAEVPFYQIGAEQGFLPKVVQIRTGFATTLPGNGTIPAPVAAPDPSQALLMGPAERADVIVDFKGMANGTRIRMINTAPDAPFGGLPDVAADPSTTGQVMDFIVNATLTLPSDATTTSPQNLVLPAEAPLGAATNTRQLSLNELSSDQVCVEIDPIAGAIVGTLFSTVPGDPNFLANCAAATVVTFGNVAEPMGPRQALLGVLTTDGLGNVTAVPKKWSDAITETPALNSTEIWEIYNTTVDAHPIHVHLVAFQVINREDLDPAALAAGNLVPSGVQTPPNPNEMGYKDTVVAFPGQITRIKAKFDIAGLYVWHCHIVEHEDNEMMRPFTVVDAAAPTGTIEINGGATVTNKQTATLALTASSSAGTTVTQMQFSKDGIFFYPFEPFATTRIVTLLPGDGLKTLTVRFKDSAGNVSAPISASITLSTVAPTGTISINGGATATNTLSATLTLSATATAGTVTQMQFSKDGGVNYFAFEPFATTRVVTLLQGGGLKTVTVRFKDSAGNVSAPVSDSITLDTTPPTGTISFPIGATTTAATGVLALTASGVTQMQFSKNNGVNYFALEPFAANRTVSLAPGLNTLTVRFKDGAGNLSAPISTTITRN